MGNSVLELLMYPPQGIYTPPPPWGATTGSWGSDTNKNWPDLQFAFPFPLFSMPQLGAQGGKSPCLLLPPSGPCAAQMARVLFPNPNSTPFQGSLVPVG